MKIHNLSQENSILNSFVAELRDIDIQKDSMRFRRNIERIAEILSYEMSKTLDYFQHSISTPLGISETELPDNNIVICSILRAGIPMHYGVLNYFDRVENAFISAYRKKINESDFEIVVEYFASPSLEGKTLILVDPMAATGKSLVSTINALKTHGKPSKLHILSIISSVPGVEFLNNNFDDDVDFWVADIDPELNSKSYIVPGLGDAGDLAFGNKL